jgi:geranylgeranyl pyrophosphate synthase
MKLPPGLRVPAGAVEAATQLASIPALVRALATATRPGGASALEPSVPDAVWWTALTGPATAFLSRPGKDLRARFVRTGWVLAGGEGSPETLTAIAQVLEILHAGSLIVDDVEDRSDERRGQPALHALVGDALAINTGSWMYFWALAELSRLALPGALELAIDALVRCHQGQALDLSTRVVDLAPRDVPSVVATTTWLKTGALCRLALELGALAAGATAERRTQIGDLGEAAGCALQMLDDLGSIVSPARRDKGYEDLRALRPTWVWAWLANSCDPFTWARLTNQARLGADPSLLADALAERVESIGRRAVRARLERAIENVRSFAPSQVANAIANDLTQMERMYG